MTGLVIIDDGVNEGLYSTGDLFCNLEITPELRIVERHGYDKYSQSHGTTCAAIIKKYSPDAEIGSIKILSDNGHAVREQLTAALLWCADNAVKLVNLSLGTVDFRDYEAVLKAVNYAAQKGVILISACSNKSIYTYPASLSNAIGVKCDFTNSLKEGQYIYNFYPLDGADITGCPTHFIKRIDGSGKTTSACNSFVTPMITAIVYNILLRNQSISLEKMKQRLAEGAVNLIPKNWNANMYHRIDWVESALVFDAPRKDKVKISYMFTVKRTVNIECANTGQFFEKALEYIINNETLLSEIDTVVVIYDITGYLENNLGRSNLIYTLEHMGKNLVFLDDYNQEACHLCGGKNIKIFHPSICKAVMCTEEAYIGVPVVAVYDFNGIEFLNMICRLKKTFRKNGYNAIAVSHKCIGLAADVDYIPEIENVESRESESIRLQHVNRVYCPDIIIWGIDASGKEPDYLKKLESRYVIDIKITVSNGQEPAIRITTDSESKAISTSAYGNDGIGIKDISDNVLIDELYKQLIVYLQ